MPEATLPELKKSLLEGKGKEAENEQALKVLKDANKTLETRITSIEQTGTEYRGKQLDLQKRKDQQECVQKDTLERVKKKLGDTAPTDLVIAAYDDKIAQLVTKLAEVLEPPVAAAKIAYDAAVATESKAKEAVEAVKNRVKTLEAALRVPEDLAKQISEAEDKGQLAVAYFLLLEHRKELAKVGPIPDPAQQEADLIRAQEELAVASADVPKKKQALDDAAKPRDEAKKELEKLQSERRAALVKQLTVD